MWLPAGLRCEVTSEFCSRNSESQPWESRIGLRVPSMGREKGEMCLRVSDAKLRRHCQPGSVYLLSGISLSAEQGQ